MPKSRKIRRSLKKGKSRRRLQKRQRGGAQVDIILNSQILGFLDTSVEETSKPRDVLKHFIQKSTKLPKEAKEKFLSFANETNPNFLFGTDTTKLESLPSKWDEPYEFKKGSTYYFEFRPRKQAQQERAEEDKSIEALKLILNHFKQGKIILSSMAVERDKLKKNVRQQFLFEEDPKTPIVLIDMDFFKPEAGCYDFYKYLNFRKYKVDGISKDNQIEFYRKENDQPIDINPDRFSDPRVNRKYKEEYLAETQKQAAEARVNLDQEIRICVCRYYFTRETQQEIEQYATSDGRNFRIFTFGGDNAA